MIIHPQEHTKDTECLIASYNSLKEWRADPKGYFTIKPFYDDGVIRVRFCNYKHEIILVIQGRNAEEIYNTIVRKGFVSKLEHAAYLGYELQKAEIALKNKLVYVQDDPLNITKKVN